MSIKIGLDAGHGLNTVGKQTPDKIKEWTLNDKVRDKVVSLLSAYDCEIIHTDNDEGNTDESLASRVNKYINAGVTAFVSIHHNAFTGAWNGATGVEVYTDKKPTTADLKLADCIYGRLVNNTGLKGRGIKRENFYVINQNKIPAVLVEGGFMDGTSDYKVITSEDGQNAYARAVAEGLIEFLNLKKKVITSPTPAPTTPVKTDLTAIAKEVIAGKWGNGEERKKRLKEAGYSYSAVQAEVNKLVKGTATAPKKKSNEEIAREVLQGKWGNGAERKKRLADAGYDYSKIQPIVNKLCK
jgi:N-acetylmuramoyl-L-alanine amidase